MGSQKMNIFGGMKVFWIFFFGVIKNWTSFRGHFYAFCSFLFFFRLLTRSNLIITPESAHLEF